MVSLSHNVAKPARLELRWRNCVIREVTARWAFLARSWPAPSQVPGSACLGAPRESVLRNRRVAPTPGGVAPRVYRRERRGPPGRAQPAMRLPHERTPGTVSLRQHLGCHLSAAIE